MESVKDDGWDVPGVPVERFSLTERNNQRLRGPNH